MTTINIAIPSKISSKYSLSIKPSTYGLILGNSIIVRTYAKSHFDAANKLKKNLFYNI